MVPLRSLLYLLYLLELTFAIPQSTAHQTSSLVSSSTVPPTSSSISTSSVSLRPDPTGNAHPGKKNPKRGLGFAAGDSPGDINNANQTASVISWQYNWANLPPTYLATSNIPFVPMQWGSPASERFVDIVRAQGANVVLAFNEPDYSAEANMDPVEAASLWMSVIEPLKEYGVKLGAPVVTAMGSGRPWLEKFFEACSQCTIDFLPLHWYGSGIGGFYEYLGAIHGQFPRYPIWITEFASTSNNDTEVYEFMNQTLTYLDGLDWVERYAWFGFFRPKPDVHYSLLRDDGGLNALGELYIGAKTVHTEIITNPDLAGYSTVNGADDPRRPLGTSFPSVSRSEGTRVLVRPLEGLGLLGVVLGLLMQFF